MNYLKIIQEIADEISGGHFTIFSFTHHYKGCFGTITEREEIENLKAYPHLNSLFRDMIKHGMDQLEIL